MGGKPYDVGYGKPPLHTRFRPGHSGNPRGRPAKPRATGEMLERILKQNVMVREGEVAARVNKQQALLMSLLSQAIKGNTRAAALILRIMEAQDQSRAAEVAAETTNLMQLPIDKAIDSMSDEELEWSLKLFDLRLRNLAAKAE